MTNEPDLSSRGQEWLEVSAHVLAHVESYTVATYGDKGQDRVTALTAGQCVMDAKKYCERFGRNQRGEEEQKKDMLKAIHYLAMAYKKLCAGEPAVRERVAGPDEF